MYIETSSPRVKGDYAILLTPVIKAGSKCMTFFYHMYGPNIDTLSIHVTANNKSFGAPIWRKTGTQGNVWRNATISVNNTANFQVSNVWQFFIIGQSLIIGTVFDWYRTSARLGKLEHGPLCF